MSLSLPLCVVNDAVRLRMEAGELRDCDVSTDVVLSDTMDQFRTFQMCEKLLHSPSKLANQLLFQIPPQKQAMMIERYTHTHTHTHTHQSVHYSDI